ncbi:MAG TPA: hypothetical protein VEZ50_17885 [Nodosilinea sp.]|nr:hypothetical protein [Nodosilinea sp.]
MTTEAVLEAVQGQQTLSYGCAWVKDYLRTNGGLAAGDRSLCKNLDNRD